MTRERFEYLLQQYLIQQMTSAELKEFLDAAVLPEFEPLIKAALDRDLQSAAVSGSSREGQAMQSFENFKQLMAGHHSSTSGKYRRMRTGRTAWLRYAAILILVAGTVTWMLLKQAPDQQGKQPLTQQTTTPIDIAPGGNKAQLTLSDGSVILLDSAANGMLAQQGNMQVVKQHDGQLEYQLAKDNKQTAGIAYNILQTPRGGQYQLTLPDGSKVWLNAASSISYPTAFAANERVVTVTGEVYFEVATLQLSSGQKMPFIVKTARQEVEVLGTHFNINAYEDEPGVKTTLLEGRVRVSAIGSDRKQTAVLKPGEQVSLSHSSHLSQPIPVQTDNVMAWKNGIFNFHKASLHEVMRQLSRWYNVEVVYEKGIPDMEFGGEMGRDLTLAQALKGFEDMEIHFKIEAGNRLIVMP